MAGTVTSIQTRDGKLLWAPNTVAGQYSIAKTAEVAAILGDLLNDVTINTRTIVDEQSESNVYTKSQSDERFVLVNGFDSLLQAKVAELVLNETIPNQTEIDTLRVRLQNLWITAHGTDFNGNQVQNTHYDGQLADHETKIYANTQDLLRVLNDVYNKGTDGSTINFNDPKFAEKTNTGTTSDLRAEFRGTNRDTLAKAINYVFSLIDNRNTFIGSSTLKTNANNLAAAINELYDTQATSTSLAGLSSTVSQVSADLMSLSSSVTGTQSSYNAMDTRVSNVEGRVSSIEALDGNETLSTTKKTLKGAINELKTDIGTVEDSISNINNRMSVIGNTAELNSNVYASDLVKSINKLYNVVSNLSQKVSGLESRIEALEG